MSAPIAARSPALNTTNRFGSVARALHWATALMILTAIPLGVIANALPYDTADALARKAWLFSLHKTLGVAVFLVALARIGWAVAQPRPVPLHPDRKAEVTLAAAVHWLLYLSLVAVPLSGWVHHAAVTGFAPIWWPFGQDLPFVPKSEALGAAAGAAHWVFTKVLAVAILLHVAGAVKHHVIDRDATLLRMVRGVAAPGVPRPAPHGRAPLALALLAYAAAAGVAGLLVPPGPAPAAAPAASAAAQAPATATSTATATTTDTADPALPLWQVEEGRLTFRVVQMGAEVEGAFAAFAADIRHDPAVTLGETGTVDVRIDTASVSIGSVTEQAHSADFFDVAAFPEARFAARLLRSATGHEAQGTLSLRGVERPLTLPFTLTVTDGVARMTGEVTLDRRDFGLGAAYPDEASVGFAVTVQVDLTARRVP